MAITVAHVGRLFRINGDIPPAAALRPVITAGVLYPQATATDLNGRPVGARGFPAITLTFERMSAAGLRWWNDLIPPGALSYPVTSLVLPDILGRTVEGYPFHNTFPYGILWRPEIDAGGNRVVYSGADWIEGTVSIRITELGRKPYG